MTHRGYTFKREEYKVPHWPGVRHCQTIEGPGGQRLQVINEDTARAIIDRMIGRGRWPDTAQDTHSQSEEGSTHEDSKPIDCGSEQGVREPLCILRFSDEGQLLSQLAG